MLMMSLSQLNCRLQVYRLVILNFDPDTNKNSNNFRGVDLSFYEDLIHKHTVRKDKETEDSKDHGEKSRKHGYTIYYTFHV